MSTPLRSRSNVIRGLLVTLALVAVLLGFGPAGPASAHSELLASDPTSGAVLDASPATITLTFNEAVEIDLGAIRLFDGSGSPVLLSDVTHPGGDTSKAAVDVPELANGSYVVSWQVVSADSHPASGAFTFQVGSASTLAAGVLSDVTSGVHTNGTAAVLLGFSRALIVGGMAIVGGILAAIALGAVEPSRRRRLAVQIAAAVGGAAGLLSIPLEKAYVSGAGLGTITDFEAWRSIIGTRIGTAWLVRAVVLYFAGFGLAVTARMHRAGWWRSSVVALLFALGAASAYGGHGGAGRWILAGTVATIVHVAAMSVWIGGLVALLIGIDDVTHEGARRYSTAAFASATLVVLSGTVQGIRQIKTADALFSTDYGRLLLAKIFAVALVLGFAAASRAAVQGKLVRPAPAPAMSVGAAAGFDRATLRRSVGAEVLFAAGIVVLTASLMGANPIAQVQRGPFSTTVVSNDYLASITVDPGRPGPNQVHIYLSSPGGSLSKPDSVTVELTDPAKGVNPLPITVVPAGASHYQAVDATIPYPATWTLTIRAIYNTFDEVVFTTEVPVR